MFKFPLGRPRTQIQGKARSKSGFNRAYKPSHERPRRSPGFPYSIVRSLDSSDQILGLERYLILAFSDEIIVLPSVLSSGKKVQSEGVTVTVL
jgi:hypothetical protein